MDASSAPADIYLVRRASFNTFTQELNLLSTSNSDFQWVVGAYYLHSHQPLVLSFVNFPNPPLSVVADHTNEAAFASGTYKFSPQWSVTLGGRYSRDSLPYTEYLPPIGTTHLTQSKPTGTAKLDFQVTPDTLVYASVSTGYKAGGINLQIPPIFTPRPSPAETNVVEELGLKTTLLDNHLRINGDVFNSQYDHYQLQESNPQGFPLTPGPGNANIYGVEVEVTGAVGGFQANVGVSWLDATVSSDFAFTLPTGAQAIVAGGTTVPFAPKWLVNAGIQYAFRVGDGTLTPRVQYHYQASQYTVITNQIAGANVDDILPSHSVADARLTYAASERWTVEAYALNLANTTYIAAWTPSPIGVTPPVMGFGAPRQFGGRFTYRF